MLGWDLRRGETALRRLWGTRGNGIYLNSTNPQADISSRCLPFPCPHSYCHSPSYFQTFICRIHATAWLAWKMSKCPFTSFFVTFPPPAKLQRLGIRKLNFLPLSWTMQGQSLGKRNLQSLPSNAPSFTLPFKTLPKISSQNLSLYKG